MFSVAACIYLHGVIKDYARLRRREKKIYYYTEMKYENKFALCYVTYHNVCYALLEHGRKNQREKYIKKRYK